MAAEIMHIMYLRVNSLIFTAVLLHIYVHGAESVYIWMLTLALHLTDEWLIQIFLTVFVYLSVC